MQKLKHHLHTNSGLILVCFFVHMWSCAIINWLLSSHNDGLGYCGHKCEHTHWFLARILSIVCQCLPSVEVFMTKLCCVEQFICITSSELWWIINQFLCWGLYLYNVFHWILWPHKCCSIIFVGGKKTGKKKLYCSANVKYNYMATWLLPDIPEKIITN